MNESFERTLIGLFLSSKTAQDEILPQLTPDQVSDPRNSEIIAAMKKCQRNELPVDFPNVLNGWLDGWLGNLVTVPNDSRTEDAVYAFAKDYLYDSFEVPLGLAYSFMSAMYWAGYRAREKEEKEKNK